MNNNIKSIRLIAVLSFLLCITACKKFTQIDIPVGSVDGSAVYSSDATATAGILGLYANNNYVQSMAYTAAITGLASDELNTKLDDDYYNFQTAVWTPNEPPFDDYLWRIPYAQVLFANIAIAGMKSATTLTPLVKSQLTGEAEFWRAHAYFALTNYFGAVPLYTSPVITENATLPRSSSTLVYDQILSDLKEAKSLLATTSSYAITERARVNQYAVSALLARIYLFKKDWANAESEANRVIGSGLYSLPAPEQVFLNTSNETILQLARVSGVTYTASLLNPASADGYRYNLAPGFAQAFEPGDKRFTNWTKPIEGTGLFGLNKYKLRSGTAGNEYYIFLRLAEQYLIRAEARTQQNNLSGALEDLNALRKRAGLSDKSGLNQAQLLLAIEQERRVELFSEWAYRWFDLKRMPSLSNPTSLTRADDLLPALKPAWKATNILFPISTNQLISNPNLQPQNPGY